MNLKKFLVVFGIIFFLGSDFSYCSSNEEKKNNKNSNFLLDFFGETFTKFFAARIDYLIVKNGFNDHLKRVLNQKSDIKFEVLQKGHENSKTLKCGQVGIFEISFEDSYGFKKRADLTRDSLNLSVGTSGLGSSFDLGVLGMKEGEERGIEIKKIDGNLKNIKQKTPYEIKEEKKFSQKTFIKVKLNKIFDGKKEKEIEDFYEKRVLEKGIPNYHILKNFAPEIHCGSLVFLHFRILDEKGFEIYDSSKNKDDNFVFQIGSGKMPLIFEWALDGTHYGDQKIVFSKSEDLSGLLKFIKDEKLKNIIQTKKNFILEINSSLKNP